MMSRYPPGVSEHTSDAPWNQEDLISTCCEADVTETMQLGYICDNCGEMCEAMTKRELVKEKKQQWMIDNMPPKKIDNHEERR